MDRVPSNGWTGSRAASLMSDDHDWPSTWAEEHLPDRSAQWSSQGLRFCLSWPLLKQLPCHTGLGRSPDPPHGIIPTGFKRLGDQRESSHTCCHHLLGKVATTWAFVKVLFVLQGHSFLRELWQQKSIPSKGHRLSYICFPSVTPTFMPDLCSVLWCCQKGAFMVPTLPWSITAGDITTLLGGRQKGVPRVLMGKATVTQ